MILGAELEQLIAGSRIFLTGHTGFKGSWLTTWLHRYGCKVTGYALPSSTEPNLFTLGRISDRLARHHEADIQDQLLLMQTLADAEPELVIHMAAQPIVRYGYSHPTETWATNVMGTVHLLEAVRACPTVKAVLVITTDKCYENREWRWGYREIDALGGHDPYSSSKAATEFVVQSYRKSFFSSGGPLIASARAGNVIGGGDWGQDRLIPDIARAVAGGCSLSIRSPKSTRPWQHVLDCLHGYILLSAKLLDGKKELATAFNFGPTVSNNVPVEQMLDLLQAYWPELNWKIDPNINSGVLREANHLHLDSTLARQKLGWVQQWDLDTTLQKTADWYRSVLHDPNLASEVTCQQLDEYLDV